MAEQPGLKRALSLPMMVLYGLGTTIGAGIYALIGEVAGRAGMQAPLSFLLAALMAGFTALSFAELASRYPRTAGAALYVRQGLRSPPLALLVGLLVVLAAVVSAAALANGFVGYLGELLEVNRAPVVIGVVVVLGGLAAWGVVESVLVASLVTLIEIGGLVWVVVVGAGVFAELPLRLAELLPSAAPQWGGVYAGAILAFYAFIGFEDMVEMAEETRRVRRNLPLAIMITLVTTTLLYLIIMLEAVLSLPPAQLAHSEAPFALLYEHHTGKQATLITLVGMFAIINGALIQMVMAARVLYGLGSRGELPRLLSRVHPLTHTPLLATLLVTACVVALALAGRLASLAVFSSLTMLMIHLLVNLALLRVKRTNPVLPGVTTFPVWVPWAGLGISLLFVITETLTYLQRIMIPD